MKLKFDKNPKGETIVTADGCNFVSQNYIDMIKKIYAGIPIKVEFGEKITKDEQDSINIMIKALNEIGTLDDDTTQEYETIDDINPDDIPF